MFDLTDKVALITGSSRGIGRAIAETFARAGAKVVVSSRKLDACEQVVREIRQAGREATAITCNVSSSEDCIALANRALDTYGKVDILVGNAAVNPKFATLGVVPLDAYQKVIDANIRGNLLLCQQLLPQMQKRKDGTIIIISSAGGAMGTPGTGVYSMSKAANMSFIRTLAVEYGPDNIRANAIAPGLIETDMARLFTENPEFREKMESRIPLRRLGQPLEIAGIALSLASAAGSYITGQTIVVDGGTTITPSGG